MSKRNGDVVKGKYIILELKFNEVEEWAKKYNIKIDKTKCNGCGLCAAACHEGAIGMVDGVATLLRDDYCDGLGDCLPACPAGAITFEEREGSSTTVYTNDNSFDLYKNRFAEYLADDLNTASAISILYDVLKSDLSNAQKRYLVKEFDKVLSLNLLDDKDNLIDDELVNKIAKFTIYSSSLLFISSFI